MGDKKIVEDMEKHLEADRNAWAEVVHSMSHRAPTNDPNAPHVANVHIVCEINERDEVGRTLPVPSKRKTYLHTFLGNTLEEAENKAEEFLERLNDG